MEPGEFVGIGEGVIADDDDCETIAKVEAFTDVGQGDGLTTDDGATL